MDPLTTLQFGLGGELFGVSLSALAGQAIAFVLGFLATWALGRLVLVPLLVRLLQARGFTEALRSLTKSIANALVLFAAVAVAFMAAGFPSFLTAAATLSGALALAVGFAAQDLVGNFVAGVFIIKDKPFEVGDWIEWSGNSGRVEQIDLRVSTVRTFDNERITVPNSDLANNAITNPVAYERLRQKFVFGIGYDDDIDLAREAIVEEIGAVDGVLDEPEPTTRVTELGDSAVGIQARFWIDNPDRGDYVAVRSDAVQQVKERFDDEGIDMPYVHRQLVGEVDVTERAES
ncbi:MULTISPECIES: mechanosensitive ion channel family protein [Halolamina]|uniref:Mechanosensitive ion channel n=1 Tax=Halolamina pelagica TaxID=699431 RepID=A0A1I5SUJ9_9EURY|nr:MULTISPECIES: mechanosensitive ion channel family protein [Halolamina]NHX36857.1 mechanosensitive ion channel family protein [Halolamina sp. R1-12]SFP74177.1 Mechanosensitive ion channel [Halolamina pelagica]